VDWTALYPAGRVVTLPPYIWQRQRYWLGVSEEPVPAVAGVSSTPLTDITAPEVDDGNGLARLPADERRRRLLTLARHHIAAELVLPVGKVALGRPLADLGLDSLMATAVRRRLESVLGVELPATLLWNCPTLDALAVHLNDLLDGDGSALAEQGEAQRGSGGVLALLTALESEES
jgi:acyl carrier protein